METVAVRQKNSIKKIAVAGVFIAVAVVCSPFSIPVGASKCFPVQHLVNVLAAVFLGPFYGVAMAFATSVIRVAMGTGSLLAFPGSMCGALLCGLVYRWTKNLPLTYLGEVFGTGIVGGLVAYPVAAFVMGKEAALFAYVFPFGISSLGGTILAVFLVAALKKTKALERIGL